MDAFLIARVAHVLALVHWIGGVTMVTLVILPAVLRLAKPEDRLATFESVEQRFGKQAKLSTQVVGLSGAWMLWEIDGWWMLIDPEHWWLMLMVLVWALFSLVLFLAEPLFLHRWFHRSAERNPAATFTLVLRLHHFLMALSLAAVAGGVLGAHGGF